MFLSTLAWELPITDPVLKFLIILIIILFSPILLERIKVPPLLGLIIAGAIIGPHGFNLILRDSGIIMSGTAGLLYIMFLAGLEIDIADFKKNSWKSLVFGIYTFCIPMVLGFLVSFYIFQYDMLASILLASMLASHTLIAYVIISKFGLSQDPAVSITVGGTMITDTLALLVLTIIVGMDAGEVDKAFWIRLCISILVFIMLVLFVFPPLCRSFFKKYNDSISQYIFVLALVFLGAFIAELAGTEMAAEVVKKYADGYVQEDDSSAWFERVKQVAADFGFCTDMKAYRADPAAYPGSTADVSTFIRVAVTGKKNTPELNTIMSLLGKEEVLKRLYAYADKLKQ